MRIPRSGVALAPAIACLALITSSFAQALDPCPPGSLYPTQATLPAGLGAVAPGIADFNADGAFDIAVLNYDAGTVTVYLGEKSGGTPTGAFGPPHSFSAGEAPRDLAIADFNGDGVLDLAVSNQTSGTVRLLIGHATGGAGDGTFPTWTTWQTGNGPRGILFGDFNEDGIKDLAVACGGNLTILTGLGSGGVGNGTFSRSQTGATPSGWGLAAGDFNSDGITDLAMACNSNQVFVFIGLGSAGVGNGSFADGVAYFVGGAQGAIAAGDFNKDGITDLAAAAHGVVILTGNGTSGLGNGTFSSQRLTSPDVFGGILVADLDVDHHLDVAGVSTNLNILRGNSSGFDPAENYPLGTSPARVASADLNADGTPDLVVANSGSNSLSILLGACRRSGPPAITGFNPTWGFPGASVTIQGFFVSFVTEVKFNGVSASFSLSPLLTAIVPPGATTGPIMITSPEGSATSTGSFEVRPVPQILAATPSKAKLGVVVKVSGSGFTGATGLRFQGGANALQSVDSDNQITAVVDSLAKTGPITIQYPTASVSSSFVFEILPSELKPTLVSVKDVRSDQGGIVVVRWLRSDFDFSPQRRITGYRVWRRASAAVAARGRAPAPEAAGFGDRSYAPAGGEDVSFWEAVATLPAAYLESYSYTAATTQDSMENDNPYTAFFVQALTADSFVFYSSDVDSGYSVDNLAPAQPHPFVAVYGPSSVALHWEPNLEADLRGYRLYRGNSLAFAPSPQNLIAATSDTGYVDVAGGTSGLFYKLAAVDIHGNQSRFALVTPEGPTPALASLVSAIALSDRVTLTWYSAEDPGLEATVYRRSPDTQWSAVGVIAADGTGRLSYVDRDVSPGSRFAYRLGVIDGGREIFLGETWVDVPFPVLSLDRIRPNPLTRGAGAVDFTLTGTAPATLSIFDVAGRQVSEREVGASGPGSHSMPLVTGARMKAGVYLVRLRQGGRAVWSRAVVLP